MERTMTIGYNQACDKWETYHEQEIARDRKLTEGMLQANGELNAELAEKDAEILDIDKHNTELIFRANKAELLLAEKTMGGGVMRRVFDRVACSELYTPCERDTDSLRRRIASLEAQLKKLEKEVNNGKV